LGMMRCPKIGDRAGVFPSVARTKNFFRVQFGRAKSARSLHRSYVTPIDFDETRPV
jgi:hypothetical protein